jgi:hypothetical protein
MEGVATGRGVLVDRCLRADFPPGRMHHRDTKGHRRFLSAALQVEDPRRSVTEADIARRPSSDTATAMTRSVTDRTRAWDRSSDRRPVFAVSETSHFDRRV